MTLELLQSTAREAKARRPELPVADSRIQRAGVVVSNLGDILYLLIESVIWVVRGMWYDNGDKDERARHKVKSRRIIGGRGLNYRDDEP